ncbi:hypothetical protein AWV80_07120 [Cupriavidus sp. UYMU48A]|nr:hypothetical protein AWV80_07120 [Cupriavidus sp. UYMU48A]
MHPDLMPGVSSAWLMALPMAPLAPVTSASLRVTCGLPCCAICAPLSAGCAVATRAQRVRLAAT